MTLKNRDFYQMSVPLPVAIIAILILNPITLLILFINVLARIPPNFINNFSNILNYLQLNERVSANILILLFILLLVFFWSVRNNLPVRKKVVLFKLIILLTLILLIRPYALIILSLWGIFEIIIIFLSPKKNE